MKVTVNNNYRRKLAVNSFYKNLYNETKNPETKNFLKQKIEKAQWFKQAIKQREETLLGVMNNIVKIQEKYFISRYLLFQIFVVLPESLNFTGEKNEEA